MSSSGTLIAGGRWRFPSEFAHLQRLARTLGFVALVVFDGVLAVLLVPLAGTSCANVLSSAVPGCRSPLAFTLGIVGIVAAIALIDLGILVAARRRP